MFIHNHVQVIVEILIKSFIHLLFVLFTYIRTSNCRKVSFTLVKPSKMDWKNYAQEIYFNPANKGAFYGPKKLQQILNERYTVSYHKVKNWLQNQDAYSLHQPVQYKIKRDRIVSKGIDDLWDMDLADVSNIAKYNEGNKFWLIMIDVFSKSLWVEPVKDKTHQSITNALQKIFDRTNRRPKNIRSDNGAEFKNKWVNQFFKKNEINAYTTKNETKANYAERVIRTLKTMMYRYFSHKETYTYIETLQDLVSNYNNSPHTTLNGRAPNDVTHTNEAQIWKEMYIDSVNKKTFKPKPFKFKVGDKVRISHLKYIFQRDYQQKWTEEVFKIDKRFKRRGLPIYKLKDYEDEPIVGNFYQGELQKIDKDDDQLFKVERVIKERRRRGVKELYVKWRGWPKKFNSWVKESDIVQV